MCGQTGLQRRHAFVEGVARKRGAQGEDDDNVGRARSTHGCERALGDRPYESNNTFRITFENAKTNPDFVFLAHMFRRHKISNDVETLLSECDA